MKKKYTITFTVDAHYPHIDKHLKKLSKDFDKWLKQWATECDSAEQIMPTLYEPNKKYGSIEHAPSGKVRVKIVRDGEIILETHWEELSNDF